MDLAQLSTALNVNRQTLTSSTVFSFTLQESPTKNSKLTSLTATKESGPAQRFMSTHSQSPTLEEDQEKVAD